MPSSQKTGMRETGNMYLGMYRLLMERRAGARAAKEQAGDTAFFYIVTRTMNFIGLVTLNRKHLTAKDGERWN